MKEMKLSVNANFARRTSGSTRSISLVLIVIKKWVTSTVQESQNASRNKMNIDVWAAMVLTTKKMNFIKGLLTGKDCALFI